MPTILQQRNVMYDYYNAVMYRVGCNSTKAMRRLQDTKFDGMGDTPQTTIFVILPIVYFF